MSSAGTPSVLPICSGTSSACTCSPSKSASRSRARVAGGKRFVAAPAACAWAMSLNDLVERAGHGIERGETLDHPVAGGDGLAALDRVALGIERGARAQIAVLVCVRFIKLRRKGMLQIGEDHVAGRQIDVQVRPFLGWNLGQTAIEDRLASRNQLDDGGMARLQVRLDGFDERGGLQPRKQRGEEALLGALKHRQGGGLCLPDGVSQTCVSASIFGTG